MTQQFEIPNNLNDSQINREFENAKNIWRKFAQPSDGDIIILNGSWGPYKYVYYTNNWYKF